MPIDARSTGGDNKLPNSISVVGLDTMIPEFARPKEARKKPIPEPIASFRSLGISFKIDSLTPITVIIKNNMLDRKTAARAACHDTPIPRTTV